MFVGGDTGVISRSIYTANTFLQGGLHNWLRWSITHYGMVYGR